MVVVCTFSQQSSAVPAELSIYIFTLFQIASKEGYLTKLGYHRKVRCFEAVV